MNFFDIERLIHSLKAVIACLAGFAIARFFGMPTGQWIIITVIVVMCAQVYVGSVVQKAYLRFLGTLLGCLFASLTLYTLGDTNFAVTVALTLSVFIFSYAAAGQENLKYAGTLGAVTTAIIMLGQKPTFAIAIERFLEISIGILIAATVSQFILPIHARAHLRRAQAKTLTQLRDYYLAVNTKPQNDTQTTDPQELEEAIVKSLLLQRQLAKESVTELLSTTFSKSHFTQSLYCEREMLRAITFMHTALTRLQQAIPPFGDIPGAKAFNDGIIQSLNTIVATIKSDIEGSAHIHTPPLAPMKTALQNVLPTLSQDHTIYLDGLLFSAEVLNESITRLATLYGIRVLPSLPIT